jgi:general secretion pathway protein G
MAARSHAGFTYTELVLVMAILAILALVAVPFYQDYRDKIKVTQAVGDIVIISAKVSNYYTDTHTYPASLADVGLDNMLDPWGNPYQYTNLQTLKGKLKARMDKSLVPINSDFDLYSMGPDGSSVPPLTAKASHDDIIRANNGQFVGPASDY